MENSGLMNTADAAVLGVLQETEPLTGKEISIMAHGKSEQGGEQTLQAIPAATGISDPTLAERWPGLVVRRDDARWEMVVPME